MFKYRRTSRTMVNGREVEHTEEVLPEHCSSEDFTKEMDEWQGSMDNWSKNMQRHFSDFSRHFNDVMRLPLFSPEFSRFQESPPLPPNNDNVEHCGDMQPENCEGVPVELELSGGNVECPNDLNCCCRDCTCGLFARCLRVD